MKLSVLQQHFQSGLLTSAENPLVHAILNEDDTLSSKQRFGIYQTAYAARLIDCLAEDFPKLFVLLGEHAFCKMGEAYLKAHPSTHFSVRYFGEQLSQFLLSTAPFSKQIVLSEMAAFEWAIAFTIDAKDKMPLTSERLQSIPIEQWPALQFSLHPAVQILTLKTDAPLLWQVIDEDKPARQPVFYDQPVTWRLWRSAQLSFFESVNKEEHDLLKLLQHPMPFANVLEHLSEQADADAFANEVVSVLMHWVGQGLITLEET